VSNRGDAAQVNRRRESSKVTEQAMAVEVFFILVAALILLQKSAFSLNDSHAFNRANRAHTQH
jgi:hypothetical protein